ncbi:MAG: YdcF family protein [Lachnospiraceae bacterium]|nr:YdcF family protein [Lachnospiraceae bacterium]
MTKTGKRRSLKRWLLGLLIIILLAVSLPNFIVVMIGGARFKKAEELQAEDGYQAIMVLGAGITNSNTPTPILKERLDAGIELYRAGAAPKLLMSGDHQTDFHNEVAVMKNYALAQGVPEDDIFLDHAGISTYDSMYRSKAIFGAKKLIVVTQAYHLYRACMIGQLLGMEVTGVVADRRRLSGWLQRDIREAAARPKDLIKALLAPRATHMGESISLEQSGLITEER